MEKKELEVEITAIIKRYSEILKDETGNMIPIINMVKSVDMIKEILSLHFVDVVSSLKNNKLKNNSDKYISVDVVNDYIAPPKEITEVNMRIDHKYFKDAIIQIMEEYADTKVHLPTVSGSVDISNFAYHKENEGKARTFRNMLTNDWYYEQELIDTIGVNNVNLIKY